MTVDRISPAISALTSQASDASQAGSVAGAGARSIAFEVGHRIAGEFLAGSSGRGQPQPQPYPIGQLADALGRALGATALETVELERSMGSLAAAVAADMVALADGRTLDRVDAAIAAAGGADAPATPANVAQSIEQVAALIAAAR